MLLLIFVPKIVFNRQPDLIVRSSIITNRASGLVSGVYGLRDGRGISDPSRSFDGLEDPDVEQIRESATEARSCDLNPKIFNS